MGDISGCGSSQTTQSKDVEVANEASVNTSPNDTLVSLVDVLKEQDDVENEAVAVLGGSDENNCTYSKGYVGRQAIYSCMTCVPDSKENPNLRAGICLACSLNCHDDHELIELYTKRQFRCDCGGGKMKMVKCSLDPTKFDINENNKYNQNFSGLYCICHRPYPDPEDKVIDEMIQCIICEDWYHGRHLMGDIPDCDQFSEMICGQCMDALPFLMYYFDRAVRTEVKESEPKEIPPKKQKLENNCKKGNLGHRKPGSAVFWRDDWRLHLCTCVSCMELYKSNKVEYLLNVEDTVQRYEDVGKRRFYTHSNVDPINQAISELGRVQQIDILTQYNIFRNRLKEFLNAFAQNNEIVTEDDVKRFFDTFKEEKKQISNIPHFCR